jgi:hypothetical protein
MTQEEKLLKIKKAMNTIAEEMVKTHILPTDPQALMAIGILAPNLGDFLDVVANQLIEVHEILE